MDVLGPYPRHMFADFESKLFAACDRELSLGCPEDAQNFRLAGSPVDGIAFEQDKVTIVEFNTGLLRLGPNQKHIRKLMSDR